MAGVSCTGTGVDNTWWQKKYEARKMLENAAEPPAFNARFAERVEIVVAKNCYGNHVISLNKQPYCSHSSINLGSPFGIERK